MKRYRAYLETQPFTFRSDSRALIWLNQAREEKTKYMRWSLQMKEFCYTVQHVAGRENHLADALSRHPQEADTDENAVEEALNHYPDPYSTLSALVETTPSIHVTVRTAQDEDLAIQQIIQQMHVGPMIRK